VAVTQTHVASSLSDLAAVSFRTPHAAVEQGERTQQEQIAEQRRMEQVILEISANVQQQIAHDLHDGLGQHLAGIAFMSKVLEQRLTDGRLAEASDAAKIVRLVNDAIRKTRELARGLLPVVPEADGLHAALTRWALEIEDLYRVPCEVRCPSPVRFNDVRVPTQLYHIAQEAVNNALRHAGPSRLTVSLDDGVLVVQDDGVGCGADSSRSTGLGMQIMRFRANLIGGSLEVRRGECGGTIVCCRFPA